MDFDKAKPRREEGVTKSDGSMAERSGIDKSGFRNTRVLVDKVDKLAFVIGLPAQKRNPVVTRVSAEVLFKVGKSPAPVDLRFAFSKEIKIRPMN